MKLGVTLFNFHREIKTLEDLDRVLAFLKELEIDTVQVSGIGHLAYKDVAEYCKKYDLEVCLTHNSADRILNDVDALIEEHRLLGCKNIGIGAMGDDYRSLEGYNMFIKEFTVSAKKMKEAGMQFNYHNHAFEFEKYNGRRGMDILIEDTDSDLFNFIIDTHWVQTGGCNPAKYIEKVSGRMSVCHFKDYKIVNNEREFAEIGTGNLDLDECYRMCAQTGVEYIIIEQDMTDIDIFESTKISVKNLKEIAKRNS